MSVAGDNPIARREDDVLGRADLARTFARQVCTFDASQGLVVGVLGPWGSGKTSFLNLARPEFEERGIALLEFNPWMFSGAEQLVDSFFAELAAQLKLRRELADAGKALEEYGEVFSGLAWVPVFGSWVERFRLALKLLGRTFQRKASGIGGRKRRVEDALRKLRKPILVVLDDIDRLSTSEIRDIFKLIRLTASFPNVIYVLAFDRARVETALKEDGVPGRDYLEKILQVAVDLPAPPSGVLDRQVFAALDQALGQIENPGHLDEAAWPDIFMEVIHPLLRNMRDVRRYEASAHGTLEALNGEIALADVLALEAVRVFLPDVFAYLHNSVEVLTTTRDLSYGAREDTTPLQAQVDVLIKAAGDRGDVPRAMIHRLFPAAQRFVGGSNFGSDWQARWLRERRVAHPDILRLYLERVAGEGLQAFGHAEHAWSLMSDRVALDEYLRSLDPTQLEDVIAALEVYEDDYRPDQVVPATIVLLNLLPELPERSRGFFDYDARLVVSRVTYRLVRSLKDPDAIEAATREILPHVTTLSSRLELISDVGYRENAGHKLVSEEAAADLERRWRDEVRKASVDELLKERDLVRVLLLAKREAGESEQELEIDPSPKLTFALLRSARSEVKSQAVGTRAVRRSSRIAWDVLIELYSDEETLNARIDALGDSADDQALLVLAKKYRGGWRPSEFGED